VMAVRAARAVDGRFGSHRSGDCGHVAEERELRLPRERDAGVVEPNDHARMVRGEVPKNLP